MITLSYTSLSSLHEHPHYWLNRVMGAKMPEWDFFKAGKVGHRIIQDHVSGRVVDSRMDFFPYSFPLVEEIDFDPRLNFRIRVNGKYEVQGYIDGLNENESRMLEIKTGSPWSLLKFKSSYQRKIYSLLRPDIKEQVLVTACANPDNWVSTRPKFYLLKPTQADRDEAMAWILDGIKILESGDFYRDLVRLENGNWRCDDPRCLYGQNCLFKNG